jgi:hypothetical protein
MRRITIKHGRTWLYGKMHPCIEQSNDLAPLSPGWTAPPIRPDMIFGKDNLFYVHTQGLVSVWDWVFGVAYMVAFQYVFLVKMTYTWLADRNSVYAFADEEMRRFNVPEKLKRLNARGS